VRTASLNPTPIPTMNPITGWELVVCEPPRIELMTRGILIESVESSSNLGVRMGAEEPVLTSDFTKDSNDDLGVQMGAKEPVPTTVFTEDSDDDERIIRFKRIVKTTPQSTLKPGVKHQRKNTITPNVPLNTLLYRCQTRSLGPTPVLPLPKDTVDNPATKKKTVQKTPL